MLKDDDIKVSCGRNVWPVKRNYITRQSEKDICSQSIKKRKILNESVNGIINNVCNVKLNEAKNEEHSDVHSIANKLSNKLSLQNDAKNAIIHSFTNVKAPVFKYSKCRTCRIPCSGDVFKSGKFEVNVRKLSISECLKFNDFKVASFGGTIKKTKVNHAKEEVRRSSDKDRVKKTRSQNKDNVSNDGKNHIKKDNHDLKTIEFESKGKEKDSLKNGDHQDLSVVCKDSKTKDLDVSGGSGSPCTLNPIALNGDSVKVDDIGKVNSDLLSINNGKVGLVSTKGHVVNTIVSDKDRVKKTHSQNRDIVSKDGKNHIKKDDHDLKTVEFESKGKEIDSRKNGDTPDLSVGCKDSKTKDPDVSGGSGSPCTLHPIALNGDSVEVADIGKVNSDLQNINNVKVDLVSTEGHGVNTSISDIDRVKRTRSQNRDIVFKDGKNHIKKDDHDSKTVEFESKGKEIDLRKNDVHQDLFVGCKDSKTKDLDVSGGNGSPCTLNPIALNGDKVQVDDIGKVNADLQDINKVKVDLVSTEGHGVNTSVNDIGEDNFDNVNNDSANLIVKSIPELDDINGGLVTNDRHDLINGNCENICNVIHDLKNGIINLNKGEKDLNVCAVNLKNCVVDLRNCQFKANTSIINDENIYSMVLRSRKCMVNKDNSKCHDTKKLITEINNSSIDLRKKHALNTRKLDPSINFAGKENKSIVNCESSSNTGIAKCDIDVSQNGPSIAEAAVDISDSNSMSSTKLDTSIVVCNKNCEPSIEQNSQFLQSSSSDKDENCIKTDSIDESHLQGVTGSKVKLTKLSDAASSHETSYVNCYSDSNGQNGIVEFTDTIFGDIIEENGICCDQKNINENGECNQGCQCGADFPAHSTSDVDLNQNINSEYCREHNLRHNRKHVRLKGIDENQLDSTSYDILEKEPITLYIFESVRRLEFLHNHFFTSIVKPDEDILQYMLDDVEVDIEIFDEDRDISIEGEHDDSSNKQDSSSLSEGDLSDMLSKCEWDDCTMQFNDSMKLLDHLKTSHINETSDRTLVSCLWRKCKFSNQQCSYKWLSNHIMKHCSVHPFKCVILGCDLSFATQSGLARHVPSHFNEGKVRRTCVTTGVGRENGKTKFDVTSNFVENSEENEDIGEPARKKTKYEKFVERYKATCTVKNNVQGVMNGIKCKLQISASNSSLNCGFVGRYFRFNHRVIGKRTSKDGSTDMLLCPSSTKIFPYRSFWFDGRSLAKHKSLYVDISVNDLSDDVKQHIYDNEQIARVNSKEKKVPSV